MKLIPLTQGQVAMIDDADFERVSQWKWHARRKNKKATTWYAVRSVGPRVKQRWIRMHRFILETNSTVDHRDGDGLNNQKHNLRLATGTQNNANKKAVKSPSGFKGVDWCQAAGKWRARIKLNGDQKHLGVFEDRRIAARVYDQQALELFGEFAKTNAQMGLL